MSDQISVGGGIAIKGIDSKKIFPLPYIGKILSEQYNITRYTEDFKSLFFLISFWYDQKESISRIGRNGEWEIDVFIDGQEIAKMAMKDVFYHYKKQMIVQLRQDLPKGKDFNIDLFEQDLDAITFEECQKRFEASMAP